MRRALQIAIFLACVFFSITALWNVMSDNYDVEKAAGAVACGDEGPSCSPQKTFMERTPFAQHFTFVTAKRKVDIKCVRSYVMVGDYACALR